MLGLQMYKRILYQNAVCLFTVEGKNISMLVINPDTLEEIDQLKLR